ncbi:hypothetical protein H1D32_22950 [Anaerobacillus sp. CMMVII]|uniref:hypothetical protein n=1 Tax=Anaerobacillus sp. CMMVII TaxID=2755588 RepID=UPI0021B7DE4D|nr:hypothetical protein [Anaerobacillus sp. CMMVII]MCT8140302.1 hypothetical protein [Anaerobacillus sp. CMMVII]
MVNSSVGKSKFIKKVILFCLILLISFGLLFSYLNHIQLFSYGNPFSLMTSIIKIETLKDDLVKFSEDEDSHYFISKDSNEIEYYINSYGWQLHRQKGYSAAIYKRNEEEMIVTPSSIWNFKYLVYDIPKNYKD